MTWADRLLRFARDDPKHAVVEQLTVFQRRWAEQEQRLGAAAAQSPTAAAESDLRALAAARHALTADLARALQAREGTVSSPPPAPSNGVAHNHWARLVSALEAAHEMRAQLARENARLLALDTSLAELLDALDRRLYAEGLSLRAMIARADPQALN